MSVYFERKVSARLGDVCTDITWYKDDKLAVALFSREEGGYINIYTSHGDLANKITQNNSKTISALAWHPQGSLFGAWDGGILCMFSEENKEKINVESPHRASIVLLSFNLQGSRLISADTEGGLVGWNYFGKQLLTAFHHQLTDPVSHIVFRNPPIKDLDVRGAARAAVAGDPKALDLFTNLDAFTKWRPKTGAKKRFYLDFQDSQMFFAAATSGIIFYINENGRCKEVFNLRSVCCDMLHRADKDQLLILTDTIAVLQFSVSSEGNLEEIMKVKLNGNKEIPPTMLFIKSETVAINTGISTIRLWNLDTGDNSVLSLPAISHQSEIFSSMSYSSTKGVLCAGTNAGNLVMWKGSDEDWYIESSTSASAPVKQVVWGVELLAVNTLTHLFVLKEQPLSADYNQEIAAIQTSGSNVALLLKGNNEDFLKYDISSEMQIYGVAISNKYCILWSDKSVVSHSFSVDSKGLFSFLVLGNFLCECEKIGIFEETLIVMEKNRISLRTIQGTLKLICFCSSTEGNPIVMNCFASFVGVATSMGILKVWDISRREPKQHGHTKNISELIKDFGEVIDLGVNNNGTKIALNIALSSFIPDSKLYVLELESNLIHWIDFATGETLIRDNNIVIQDICEKIAFSFYWDCNDSELLICHLKPMLFGKKENNTQLSGDYAAVLWTSRDKGILLHETISLANNQIKLLSCDSPYIIYLSTVKDKLLDRILMGDFHGVTDNSPTTKHAVLNFSYNLSIGNMDLAYKAINSVSSEPIWINLAKNCVKTKRLDVAIVCMGRLKNGRTAKALREAMNEPELEARVATLAVHLGMLDEAEHLLKNCKRYDLLNRMYQTTSDWDKAIKVAENYDRVHHRNTYHLYAKYLEQHKKVNEALNCYEKADTHRIHASRLLSDDIHKLKTYIDQSSDPILQKWLAQYMESTGDMKSALHYYTAAQDHLSVVRVLCFLNNYHQANEVVQISNDKAAAYHLARQYEAIEKYDEALSFFIKAQTYGNAIRICKENGFTEKIWSLSLSATPREQADAARYLQEHGDTHKAILLYHKAGMIHKSLDLAFRSEDAEALEIISTYLTNQTDSDILVKVADFFISNAQYERAVDILLTAGKFSDAISLCIEHSVNITEELSEKLNPTGPDRYKLLIKIGECALAQSNYYLATKKFTQAGDKVRAMKALLKSGDTEKIIFLAGVSREKDVYIMAANYLQALDWRCNPQLLNTIIQFYSKAKAHLLLSNFYVACANIEAEEYKDYEKATVALNEAKRCLTKTLEDELNKKAVENIEKRILMIHQFLECRKLFEIGEAAEGMLLCQTLLSQIDAEGPVRAGDIYALMIENEKEPNNARRLLESMTKEVSDPMKYLRLSLLEELGHHSKNSFKLHFDDDIGFEVN